MKKRPARIATIQLPVPGKGMTWEAVYQTGMELFEQAATSKPDIICLPEYFNCYPCAPCDYDRQLGDEAHRILKTFCERAKESGAYVVLPLAIRDGVKCFNRAYVIGRDGEIIGHFDKVHVTHVEAVEFGVVPGESWPVFELDFAHVGVMICYDGCFSESSRALALKGADLIVWPSLQRSYTRDELELQTRSHAFFNYVSVVRSSYGGQIEVDSETVSVSGMSCVCGSDGKIVSSLDGGPGWLAADVLLGVKLRGARTFGGEIGCLREMRFDDRQPLAYSELTRLAVPHRRTAFATQESGTQRLTRTDPAHSISQADEIAAPQPELKGSETGPC